VTPDHYDLAFVVDLGHERFEGTETIRVQVAEPTTRVVLHALDIQFREATIGAGGVLGSFLGPWSAGSAAAATRRFKERCARTASARSS